MGDDVMKHSQRRWFTSTVESYSKRCLPRIYIHICINLIAIWWDHVMWNTWECYDLNAYVQFQTLVRWSHLVDRTLSRSSVHPIYPIFFSKIAQSNMAFWANVWSLEWNKSSATQKWSMFKPKIIIFNKFNSPSHYP